MANAKPIRISADFLTTVEALLKTPPPSKLTAAERKTVKAGLNAIARAKKRGPVKRKRAGRKVR